MSELDYLTIDTGAEPDACVIWLHGLGASGDDFKPVVPELKLPTDVSVRFILPHAPAIPVTINGGYVMPAWYDILEMNIERRVDELQLRRSAEKIRNLITEQIANGIDSQRIILVGFSQGGAVAYECALSFDQPLGGLLGLSTYFATAKSVSIHPMNANIPIKIYHGSHDPIVPESLGQDAVAQFETMGLKPEYQSYPMEHQVCLPQIQDIAAWLQRQLNTKSPE